MRNNECDSEPAVPVCEHCHFPDNPHVAMFALRRIRACCHIVDICRATPSSETADGHTDAKPLILHRL